MNPSWGVYKALRKTDLDELIERLGQNDTSAIPFCVGFIEAETRGIWHNRARSKMCRRLKHCTLDASQRGRLLRCILARLRSGLFSEQFKDQLRLALHLDRPRAMATARECLDDDRAYVRRYAEWVLTRDHPS